MPDLSDLSLLADRPDLPDLSDLSLLADRPDLPDLSDLSDLPDLSLLADRPDLPLLADLSLLARRCLRPLPLPRLSFFGVAAGSIASLPLHSFQDSQPQVSSTRKRPKCEPGLVHLRLYGRNPYRDADG